MNEKTLAQWCEEMGANMHTARKKAQLAKYEGSLGTVKRIGNTYLYTPEQWDIIAKTSTYKPEV